MPRQADYHVLPHQDGWAVKRQGATRASRRFGNKQEAVTAGRDLARRYRATLRIHGRDGRIGEERTFRDDPFPPAG